jgi:CDP-diacylglycerol--glycerol-3-phosphate 3-phosphatidyltransferase
MSVAEVEGMVSLSSPRDFYEFLREQIRMAQKSITLSALYLGSGPLERELVEELRAALRRSAELRLTVILDHSRAQRSSAPLEELVDEFDGSRVKLLWYQMPQLRGLLSRVLPAQACEILAVYHCKFSVFDGGVLLSGANLSEEYFVNRQDRYLFIPDGDEESSLKLFLSRFVGLVEPHCHRVLPGRNVQPPPSAAAAPAALSDLRTGLLELVSRPSSDENLHGPQPQETALLPLLQFAPAHIDHESAVLPALLQDAADSCLLQSVALSSPYPSLPPMLAGALHRLQASTQVPATIFTSSLATHGFARASGAKALVPLMHRQALSDALGLAAASAVAAAGGGRGRGEVSSTLYDRKGWTFHAKGLWLWLSSPSPPLSSSAASSAHPPQQAASLVTYIGSSNLGERSWGRDFELGFLLSTSNPRALGVLSGEYKHLLAHSRSSSSSGGAAAAADSDSATPPVSATMRKLVPVLTRICRSFL